MANLDDLRDHARRTYRYWPIYLVLRLRELEQHLDPDDRPALLGSGGETLPDVSGLVQAGLWRSRIPIGTTLPPALPIPDDATLCFEVQPASDTAALVALAQGAYEIQQVGIMRVPSAHEHVLTKAIEYFNRVVLSDPVGALDAARLWAALHGARALNWQQVSVTATDTAPPPHLYRPVVAARGNSGPRIERDFMTDIRQQIKQARTHIAAEEWAKARAALKGIDHPKAKELLEEVELHLAEETSGGFPTGPLIVFFSLVVVLSVGGFLLVSRSNRAVPTPVLPTLAVIPTSDCTPETVRTWWGVQNVALDTFTHDASSASRTMPGERLDERLASLCQFRADFPAPPACASSEFRMAVNDLLRAMDDTIAALEGWSNSTMDGLAVTTALQEAESALRGARTQGGRSVNE